MDRLNHRRGSPSHSAASVSGEILRSTDEAVKENKRTQGTAVVLRQSKQKS
jgi:hypothetical protein